ncbi:NAD(P)H-dependent glycerol-3-phosphate dehydrogenase [Sediminibacillus albus]|uniref:Glycerol-3-phosphate dehydrogenase [NAD(P)+] n=1 Tax=Sediminibacillus albus TaxID=407036 RepID=A0A1G8VMX9_9BACI|nr:NAD(P)H-dependent glycerol-3-phosphate dehydrogenase [Sediminibacillus albus]SDJ67267.1 glycerol-3-phosphate dehydrogenase (NAD(P)+) [Sediminibacillus albus]
MEKIAVLGAGSWGTALAMVLADNSHEVRLWTHNQEHANTINQTHANEKYLPGVRIPDEITAFYDLEKAVQDVSTILLVVPTKAIRDVCKQLNDVLHHPVTLAHGTKGIEPGTFKRVSEMINEELSNGLYKEVVVLSGPSHAEEVSQRQPTTLTASSEDIEEAKKVQDLFINGNLRVYTSPDMVGVELGGALKNIIALGAGISDGLGYGDNAKAALITRGLAEIARLGTSMNANPLTFLGLTGVGDLIVTCTSVHSRNWKAGNLLGKGNKLDDVLEQMGMVVEGVRTTQAAHQLAKMQGIDMPITDGLFRILFEEAQPKDVVDQLMTRVRRHEMEDLSHILSNRFSS